MSTSVLWSAALAAGLSASPALALPLLLNDPFTDSSLSNNAGPGTFNNFDALGSPTRPWTPQAGGFPGATASIVETAGVARVSSGSTTTPYAIGQINGRSDARYDFYNPTGTTFAYTLGNMQVTGNNVNARPDIPGADTATTQGDLRYELGVISRKDPNTVVIDELYRTTTGGFFVSVFKDASGVVTGNVRETNSTKTSNTVDSEGATGIKTLATFLLPGFDGVADFTVAVTLNDAGYTVGFDRAVTVLSGSLSGGYGTNPDNTPWFDSTSFDTGAFVTAGGQNWGGTPPTFPAGSGGYGSMDIGNVRIETVPEPMLLAVLSATPVALLRRRRRV